MELYWLLSSTSRWQRPSLRNRIKACSQVCSWHVVPMGQEAGGCVWSSPSYARLTILSFDEYSTFDVQNGPLRKTYWHLVCDTYSHVGIFSWWFTVYEMTVMVYCVWNDSNRMRIPVTSVSLEASFKDERTFPELSSYRNSGLSGTVKRNPFGVLQFLSFGKVDWIGSPPPPPPVGNGRRTKGWA